MKDIILPLLKEVAMASIGKVSFKVLAERFMSRALVYALNKIKNYSSNELADETVSDVLNMLKGKKLKVIDELGE